MAVTDPAAIIHAMCTFITLAVPAQHSDLAAHAAERQGLRWSGDGDPAVRALLPSGWVAAWLTDGHCACSLIRTEAPGTHERERARRAQKYREKGWSAAKIARAMAASDRGERPCFSAPLSQLVDELFTACPEVRLHAATYAGPIDAGSGEAVADHAALSLTELQSGDARVRPRVLQRVRR